MTSLRAYRALPDAAGIWFLVVALLGRLPQAMSQIGVLLLITSTTGSLAAGGGAAATLALGQAGGGPIVGRLADRTGHRRIGLVTAVLQSVALCALVAVAASDASVGWSFAAAFLVGVTAPQVGALVRARWAGLVNHGRTPASAFGVAMSYEGAADETTYVLGPALVGAVVAVASPEAAMLLAAAVTAVFAVGFALHPTSRMVGAHEAEHVPSSPQRGADLLSLWMLSALLLCVGGFFASVQAGVTSIAVAAGSEGAAGLIYGAMGITSAVAGLLTAALPRRFALSTRMVAFPVLLLVFVLPLVAIGVSGTLSLGLLCAAVVVAGMAVAPTLITALTIGERTVPLSRVSWAMTVMSSGVVLGYATAALFGGLLAQAHGAIGAFTVTFAAVACAVLLAVIARPRLARLPAP
jgi:MFS family permease